MTDQDQTVIFPLNEDNSGPYQEDNSGPYHGDSSGPYRLGVDDDFAATENQPAEFVPGLVSLAFLKAAIGRSARFLSVLAIVGLFLGVGAYKAFPHGYQASASVLITLSPSENSESAPTDNQALAETRSVAGLAVNDLGLKESVSSFLSSYTATSVTGQLLTVTASGPSASQAVLRAGAVANAFLNFRGDELQAEQNLVVESLDQQITSAKQHISSIDAQISQLSSQLTSSTQQSQLSNLRTEQTSATSTLGGLQQAVTVNQTTTQPALTAAVKGSEILTVAALPRSKLKSPASYAVTGLILGLALGVAIVIVRALVSDRLRQRDDIAYALDAPVKVSVGRLRAHRGLPSLPGRAAKRNRDMRRVIAHLQSAVPVTTRGPASLAIVAVDNASAVAQAVAAFAASYASQGNQVVAVDLSAGAPMAHRLGVKKPGAHAVSRDGATFTVAVPERDDTGLIGPLRALNSPAGLGHGGDGLVASYASADLLLTLVTLDPALGGDHLATWATKAVVVVSAGQSSAERVHGVGEMIRLAGTRLDSIVLIEADKSDESLGLTPAYSHATA